ENDQVFANADGTWTVVESLRPRFARAVDGSWTTPDPTLVSNGDGTFSPRAAVLPLRISGGGSAALATIRKSSGSVSVNWPASLPTPVVQGATATYPEVEPGVDLRVVADVDGFSQLLIVKDRAAWARV